MSRFHIGQRVRVVSALGPPVTELIGSETTILSGPASNPFADGVWYQTDLDNGLWWFREDHLEPIDDRQQLSTWEQVHEKTGYSPKVTA